MGPTVIISARGEERLRSGHPWIYRADMVDVRAALCNDLYTARLSRQHNDANVLSMGGRIVAFHLADEILALWLETPFDGGRHQRRIDQIAAAERPRP